MQIPAQVALRIRWFCEEYERIQISRNRSVLFLHTVKCEMKALLHCPPPLTEKKIVTCLSLAVIQLCWLFPILTYSCVIKMADNNAVKPCCLFSVVVLITLKTFWVLNSDARYFKSYKRKYTPHISFHGTPLK